MNSSENLVTQFNLALQRRVKFFVCKKSKLNISLLQLLLNKGFLLNFYQFKFLKNNLCVFFKYLDKKPLIKKIVMINHDNFLSSLKLHGDAQTNVFFIVSTSVGGLLLVNVNNHNALNWYNRFGGKIIFKITI